MNPLDGLWHVLNFVAPALVTGCLTALLAKAIWRQRLGSISLIRLCGVTAACSGLGFTIAAALFERDGRMVSYAVMVASAALFPWWRLCRS